MEKSKEISIYRWAAVCSLIVGYIYLRGAILNFSLEEGFPRFGRLLFAVLFIAVTEIFARLLGVTYDEIKKRNNSVVEPVIYLICILVQSLAYVIWPESSAWSFCLMQEFMWHFTFIYYVLARTGSLAAGKSGIMFAFDFVQGVFVYPLANYILGPASIFHVEKETVMGPNGYPIQVPKKKKDNSNTGKTVLIVGVSVFVAFTICTIAISELSIVSDTFAEFGRAIFDGIDYFMANISEEVTFIMWSVPVSLYLFGLVGGALKRKAPYIPLKRIESDTKDCHLLPSYSAFIIIGSVCFVYILFFAAAVFDFVNHQGFFAQTAHEASTRAVESFWSLIRVVVLNFLVIAFSCVFSKKALWVEKGTRVLATVLVLFGLLFAVLAACNLCGVYIAIYGLTPRRILSSWVVFNVIIWSILLIIRFYKKIPAAQISIILAAVSYTAITMYQVQ